jgi:AAA15 family ATPase/GTPase
MLPVCIFHGLNNTGKSNILSAIEVIFRRKIIVEGTTFTELKNIGDSMKPEQVTKHIERIGSFWQGRIFGFKDNFYLNGKNDITFSVTVCFKDNELQFLDDVLKKLHKSLGQGQHQKELTINGKIKYFDDISADMVMESAVFNKKYIVFKVAPNGNKVFFPDLKKEFKPEDRVKHFDNLMDLLSDSFSLLPSDRYLTSEQIDKESKRDFLLSPKDFKKWLFNLSLSRSGHQIFEQIKTMFISDPFSVGDIGFSTDGNELEVMVQDKKVRLPISRLGSGYQQILYIIANIAFNKGKMMGIEELEINLSPAAQKMVFEKLKSYIYKGSDLITQIIITSHSTYFEGRTDVRRYSVTHDGNETIVEPLTEAAWMGFFPPTDKKRLL